MEMSREPGIALHGMARISNQQEYIAVDSAYLKLVDCAQNELIGFDWKTNIYPQDVVQAVYAFQDMECTGIGEFRGHIDTKRGNHLPVRVLLIQNYNEESASDGHYCFMQNATIPTTKNTGLQQGYELFRTALGDSPVGSVLLDPIDGFRRLNTTLLAQLGYAGSELAGKYFADIAEIQGSDGSATLAYLVLNGDLPGCRFLRDIHTKGGGSFPAEISVRVVRDAWGVPLYAIGFIREIKNGQESYFVRSGDNLAGMQARRGPDAPDRNMSAVLFAERCMKLFNSSLHCVAVSTLPQSRYAAVTDGFLQMFGRLREDVIGRTNEDLNILTEPQGATGIRELNESPRRVHEVEVMLVSGSGDKRAGTLSTETVGINGAVYLIQTFRDITVQKNSEELLRLSEERYQAMAQQGWEGIILVDPVSRKILEATSPFLLLTGYTRSEVANLTLYDIVEKDRAVLDNDISNVMAGGTRVIGEWPFRRKNGQNIELEVSTNMVYYDGALAVRLVGRDISERRIMEEQLRHAAKMEALGRFAGGIAHDFNNLLVGILGYSSELEAKLRESPSLARVSHQITSVALRAKELTSQLLSISRRQVLPAELLDINDVVKRAESLLRRILGEDIELQTELKFLTGRVRANPGQIEQVIINLAANSRDAMPNGGRLQIATDEILADEALALTKPGMIPGKYVHLSIKDTGSGMDSVALSHLFEPFYTTKDAGVGTGLGLSSAYGIVKQSGGFILVSSTVNVGTTFDIFLPRAEEQHSLFRPNEATVNSTPLSTTILVVEDDTTVRALVVDILEAERYSVLSARDANEALAIARTHDGRIQLVITDIVMPNMSGSELAEELLRFRSDIRILFMSGYSDKEIVKRTQSGAAANFISKPFMPAELLSKVREVLGKREI
jgi:two-component system, cell cycle sensor histidine kinase and response regulator CckA